MFNFKIKRSTVDDFKYIYRLNSRLFGEECLSEYISRHVFEHILDNDAGVIFTVNHGKNIVGYAYVTEVFSLRYGHYAEVVDFYTNEYYRKNGADVYLLKALEQWAYQVICSELRFSTDDEIVLDLLKMSGYIKDDTMQIYKKRL